MTFSELETIKRKNLETLIKKLEADEWSALSFNLAIKDTSELDLSCLELDGCLEPKIIEAIKKLVLIGLKQKFEEINK